MPDTRISENSKRVAKNTVLLYFRMFVTMLVGLYTSRVILNALGQDDFGIYGAVGGVVAMFSILTGAIAGAISRFLTFELGKSSDDRLGAVFSTAMAIEGEVLVGAAMVSLIPAALRAAWVEVPKAAIATFSSATLGKFFTNERTPMGEKRQMTS